MRLIGAVVCLLAANRGSNCSLTQAMDGRIVCCGIISSCQSAATSEIVKRFWPESDSRKKRRRYSKYRTFTFTFHWLLMKPAMPATKSISHYLSQLTF